MKLYLILFVANWALVLSKPIETQEKAEPNTENEELELADAVKDEKDSGHHHFEVKHVGSNSKLIETSKDKDFDSSIDEKLEKIEADRVKEKKEDVRTFDYMNIIRIIIMFVALFLFRIYFFFNF